MINRFQRKRQAQILNGGFEASVGQKLNQEFAQQDGPDGVARQNVGQKDRKCFSATAAVAAIRTKDPLAAAWTALLLERKSSSFSLSASATKRKGRDMGCVAAGTKTVGRDLFGRTERRDSVQ